MNTNKQLNTVIVMIFITVVFAGLIIWIISSSNSNSVDTSNQTITSNVSVEEDTQIINLYANSSGYGPSTTVASGNKKTKLVMKSTGAYGCEQALTIPKLNITKSIPANGTTEIEIDPQSQGTKLIGSCSMGMYTFTINFI